MDKKNLYYVVLKGTNLREMNRHDEPFIADKEAATDKCVRCDCLPKLTYEDTNHLSIHEIISISDYEDKFMDKKESDE